MSKQAPQVYKANALIEASYRLSVVEQRVILACIDQVRRDEAVTDAVMYSVNAHDYAKVCNTSVKNAYRDLKKASINLMKRMVWITHTPEGAKRSKTLVTLWAQAVEYSDNKAEINLRFTKDILPYLTNIKSHFTRYALSDIARMDSAHAIRLYELLVERLDFGERTVDIDWLRHALQLGDKYSLVRDFKKRVIIPAVKQINEHSPLHVEWEQIKEGRRIAQLRFKFQARSIPKKQQEVKDQKQAAKTGEDRDPNGRTFGIKNSEILAAQQEGEAFDDAAYRLNFERNQTHMELGGEDE